MADKKTSKKKPVSKTQATAVANAMKGGNPTNMQAPKPNVSPDMVADDDQQGA